MARILIEAIQNGDEALAREIIQCGSYGGIDSQTSRRDGTALFFCSSRGYLELARLLLERGASASSTDKNRATPLHGAVDNCHLDIVKLLLSHGANINAQTYRGDTALHLAAYRGFGEITQCLIESGADCQMVNTNSFTPENEAIGQGHQDLGNYLRTTQRAKRLSERASQSFDSMIPLDPPSISSVSSSDHGCQAETQKTHHQQLNHFDFEFRRKKLDNRNDASPRSKSCDYDTGKLNNLSIISLEPPSDLSPTCWNLSQRKRFSHKQGMGKSPPTILLSSTKLNTNSSNGSCATSPFTSNSIPSVPFVFYNSNALALLPSSMSMNRATTTFPQMLNPSNTANISVDSQRRPSTGSTSSCFSDLSGGTGSDTGSLPSSGSDASGFFSDNRRDDLELQDKQLTSACLDANNYDKVVQLSPHNYKDHLLSLGVRSPPVHKPIRHFSTTSESTGSSEFSDIYNSTLYSLSSLESESTSSSVTGNVLPSMGVVVTHGRKDCSRQESMEVSEARPNLNRATSTNCTFPSSNIRFKTRPDFNKSISAEYRPKYAAPARSSEICPSYDRIPSNDLSSSSFSMSDKPSCSMTCVNIPLN